MAFMVAVQLLTVLVSCSWLSRISLASYSKGCLSTGGVDASVLTTEQRAAIEEQDLIPCKNNSRDRYDFYDAILSNFGEDVGEFYSNIPTLKTSYEQCRSAGSCPGSSTITWCIHLYHPTEKVEICLDKNEVINVTDYTHLLLLECYFSVEETCPRYPQGRLEIKNPKYLLHESIMVCSVQSENCSAVSSTKLSVRVSSHESKVPAVSIHNTTDLVLGQTNLFLCEVVFTENRGTVPLRAEWKINATSIEIIHELPFCSLGRDCNKDTQATTRNNRVRAYEDKRVIPGCPFNTFVFREWLWIDNATEADTQLDYLCIGRDIFFSGISRYVYGMNRMRLNPVLPLLDVTLLEVPVLENIDPADDQPYVLTIIETETFQWTISVEAGLGDELLWLHNMELIPSTANILQVPSCLDTEVDQLFVVHWLAKNLDGYRRGLNATLVACHLTLPMAYGLYQCQLNRSRGSAVKLWSALLQIMPTTIETVTSEGPNVNQENHIDIYAGLPVGMLVVMILFLLVIFTYYMYHKYVAYQLSKLNSNLFSNADILMDRDVKGKTFESKNSLKMGSVKSHHCNDQFEFPREKLLMSDVVLGEGTFGRVVQAQAPGIVEGTSDKYVVAIKMCRENALHQTSLWDELQLMKKLESHNNIVNLLGCCSTPNGPLYLIIEYAMHGNLKDFLHERQSHTLSSTISSNTSTSAGPDACEKIPLSQCNSVFSASGEVGQADSTCFASTEEKCPKRKNSTTTPLTKDSSFFGGQNARSATSTSSDIAISGRGLLNIEDIQSFAIQIAKGLQHLEKMNVVHCDLAARNILVAEGFILKIADFGMARDVSGKECYIKHKKGMIPVKWTPPEALQEHTFSYKSDMWSYGVILWEIFTYGAKPYPDQKIQLSFEAFISYLMDGNRLPQPSSCPTYFYHLMECCWKLLPEQRPSASDMLNHLFFIDTSCIEIESEANIPISFTPSSSIFPETQV